MRIAVLGSITRDYIVIVKKGEEYTQVGGGVYYSSLTLAALGAEVVSIPILAKSDRDLLDELNHSKLEIIPQWAENTTVYRNIYPADSFDICYKQIMSRVQDYIIEEELWDKIGDCDAVHLVPLSADEFSRDLFSQLRERFSGIVSIDGQGFTKFLDYDVSGVLSKNIDILKLDDAEALHITKADNEIEAIKTARSWGIPEILVTKASRGSSVYLDSDSHSIPVYEADKIVDATGCGDAYISGYLFKRLNGCLPQESAHFASKLAAKNLEFKGAIKDGTD